MHKLNFLILLFLTTNVIHCLGQNIKTKDGVSLGERSEFISSCIKNNDEKLNIHGLKIEAYSYCACLSDNLIPSLNSWVIDKAAREHKLLDLFLEGKNFEIVQKCLDGNYEIADDFKLGQTDYVEIEKKMAIKNCVNEMINDAELKDLWPQELVEKYCECATNKIIDAGYTYKEIQQAGDENSSTFNEVVLPCVLAILNTKELIEPSNSYDINDIIGGGYRSLVPLTDYFGKGYKVKINISGVSKYYLLDTGASDLIIDRETERELLINGVLKKENYLDITEYILANNQTVKGQMVRVDNIVIGDYTLNNVVMAVIDEGSLLCGISFLDKFKKWEIDKENNVLILYK